MEEVKAFLQNLILTKGVQILWALLALIIGYIVIKLIFKIVNKTLSKSKMDKITISFLLSILKFVAYIILVLIIAQILGVPITGMVALLGTAGLAVGLALKDSLSNLANGIVIITTKPFHEGDYVKIGDVEGTVRNIRMLTTAIVSTDNKLIVLPNSDIVTNEIINYNILGKRKLVLTFSVAYESDVKLVQKVILDVIHSNGKAYLDPSPFVSIKMFNASSIDFVASCWCDAEDYWDLNYYLLDKVFNEFKRYGISIPYNQLEVRMRQDTPENIFDAQELPERQEKVREEKVEGDIIDQLIFVRKKKHKKAKEQSIKKTDRKNKKTKKNTTELPTDTSEK